MTSESILALLTIQLIVGLIFIFFVYRFVYFRSKQIENKYFLYKVRDDLILLTAKGKLEEEEFLFRELYPIVNDLINQINSFRFKHIVKAVSSQEKKVMAEEFIETFNKEIASKSPEVVEVFNNFFLAVFYIIYRNSLLLRIIYRCTKTFSFLKKCMEAPKFAWSIFSSQLRAYKYISFCNTMIRR